MPAVAARNLTRLPEWFGVLSAIPQFGPAFAAKALAASRKSDLQAMVAATDRIVAVCAWLRDALLANDVPAEKLLLNRQGVSNETKFKPLNMNETPNVFRFGFLGRWDPVKGVHILVEAFKRVPAHLRVALYICATGTGILSEKYRCDVERAAACDKRIRFLPAITHDQVSAFLTSIEALVVPSQWLETGPLVVLEAFAVETPVVGSNLGGIKELVREGEDGLLVPHDDVSAWTRAMVHLATDPALLDRLRRNIRPVRTMSDVANDMATLYNEIAATAYAA
jgi:glycosyltransferase involved in cell wall biosynthesis